LPHMVSRLTVIFFIVLCILAGAVLIVFPWANVGRVGEWGNNQLLIFASRTMNLPALQEFVRSGWVKGAVSGLGVLNLLIGFWEIVNFKQSVNILEGKNPAK
jgi:hypothetical protein